MAGRTYFSEAMDVHDVQAGNLVQQRNSTVIDMELESVHSFRCNDTEEIETIYVVFNLPFLIM